jgi:hypothetical protein
VTAPPPFPHREKTPYFPIVHVRIIDLIDDERNLPILLKRCCHAAARAQFVPPLGDPKLVLRGHSATELDTAMVHGCSVVEYDQLTPADAP